MYPVDQSKPCAQMYLQVTCVLHKFAITKTMFLINILDMHHCITYMYVNIQQNWVCRSVITVHTNILAKKCKLHKFATCN